MVRQSAFGYRNQQEHVCFLAPSSCLPFRGYAELSALWALSTTPSFLRSMEVVTTAYSEGMKGAPLSTALIGEALWDLVCFGRRACLRTRAGLL